MEVIKDKNIIRKYLNIEHKCNSCSNNNNGITHGNIPKTPEEVKKYIIFLKENHDKWHKIARPEQILPSGDWKVWLLKGGRGFGKTRAASENIVDLILNGKALRVGCIGSTIIAAREIMIEGDSGILTALKHRNISPKKLNYKYIISKNRIDIYMYNKGKCNICKVFIFNGERYNSLRGFEFDYVWIDEWLRFSNASEILTQVNLCLRNGDSRCIISTTPIKNRNDNYLSMLMKDPSTHITEGSSLINIKLSENFMLYAKAYKNTRLGEREIEGDVKLSQSWVEDDFIKEAPPEYCDMYRIGIDMAVGNGLIGMILIGLRNNLTYVIADYSTKDNKWLLTLKDICKKYHPIEIVYESNQGGNLIGSLIYSSGIRCNIIDVFASSAKKDRHYVLYMYYLYKKVIHNFGLDNLEQDLLYKKQMDRIDALWCAMYEMKRFLYVI